MKIRSCILDNEVPVASSLRIIRISLSLPHSSKASMTSTVVEGAETPSSFESGLIAS